MLRFLRSVGSSVKGRGQATRPRCSALPRRPGSWLSGRRSPLFGRKAKRGQHLPRNDGPACAFEEAGDHSQDAEQRPKLFAFLLTLFPAGRGTPGKLVGLAAAVVGAAVLGGCTPSKAKQPVPGDADAGVSTITRHACGSCHQIPGVQAANGLVGPPLGGVAARVYLAGHLLNTPDNMILWLRKPQAVFPGNAMPDLGLSDKEARDVAAYLYTLR